MPYLVSKTLACVIVTTQYNIGIINLKNTFLSVKVPIPLNIALFPKKLK